MIDGIAEARVSFHNGARARARARTSLELGLGLVRVSCIIKKWFKQKSSPSGVLVVVALARQRNEHGF